MTSSQALRYVDRIAAWPVAILDYRAMELSAANRLSRSATRWWLWQPPSLERTAYTPRTFNTVRSYSA